jgi:phage terminase small subunit
MARKKTLEELAAKRDAKRPSTEAARKSRKSKRADGWTELERAFCRHYLRHGQPGRAYLEAGAECKPEFASSIGHSVLRKPHVARYIAEKRAETARRFEISEDRVLAELSRIAFGNVAAFTGTDGNGNLLIDTSRMEEADLAAVQELTVDTYFEGKGDDAMRVLSTKVKMSPKVAALELLGKYYKLFTDKVELGGAVDIQGRIELARTRLRAARDGSVSSQSDE